MKLPRHICLYLQHNPHRGDYTPIEKWVDNILASAEANGYSADDTILPEDRSAILATGELWVISWCPETPAGSREVVAATLDRALELAGKSASDDAEDP